MKCLMIKLVMVLLVAGAAAAKDPAPAEQSDEKTIAEGNNAFALELYAKLAEPAFGGGNLFFSPYSISSALAMAYAGARGQTTQQMADVLHFTLPQEKLNSAFAALKDQLSKDDTQSGYELSVANALWGQKEYRFLEEFIELNRKYYGAGLNEVDFVTAAETARQKINAWVEKQTRGKIKDLIQSGVLGPLTRLVLTNAIYFKGRWASQFDKDRTKDEPFMVTRDKKVEAALMNQKGRFKYYEQDAFVMLELPYKSEVLSMVVILPRKIDGLAEMTKSLTAENLKKWLVRMRKREVIVYLPKFKMTSQFELAGCLGAMGMPDAFSLPPADFSGMTADKELFISNVIHKAFVAVDEEGTEAAAATGVVMGITAVVQPLVFRADRPFVFMIRDNRSGSILFIGRVVNPKK